MNSFLQQSNCLKRLSFSRLFHIPSNSHNIDTSYDVQTPIHQQVDNPKITLFRVDIDSSLDVSLDEIEYHDQDIRIVSERIEYLC